MNIDSIKNYPAGTLAKQRHKGMLEYRQKSAGLCESKSVKKNNNYNGSFTGLNVAAVAGSINTEKSATMLDKILTLCDKHTVIAQNLVALFLAAGLRPLAIMSLPGQKKDKDDKIYASGHSIASGLIGFAFSSIVMYPLGRAVEKTKGAVKDANAAIELMKDSSKLTKEQMEAIDSLKKKYKLNNILDIENVKIFKKLKETYNLNTLGDLEHSKAFKNVTKILDMAPDVFIFGVLKAMLTVALIPPILKYVFGIEKKKAPQTPKPEVSSNNTTTPPPAIPKPEIEKFAGGLK